MKREVLEKRKFKRSFFVFPVRVGIINKDEDVNRREYFHAFSDNISEGGLKVDLKKSIPLNAQLDLRFDLIIKDDIKMINTEAQVKWVRNKSNGFTEYGIIFDPLSITVWNIIKEFMKDYCKDQ